MNPPSRKLLSVLVAIGLSAYSPASVKAEDYSLEIAEHHWTRHISEDREPVEDFQGTASPGKLYLWLRVKGNDVTLEKLRSQGKLPIRNTWAYAIGSNLEPVLGGISYINPAESEDFILTDTIDLPIGTTKTINKLENELDIRGFFDWRTWSNKEDLFAGSWFVYLQYADNSPILCPNGKPCFFSIKIE